MDRKMMILIGLSIFGVIGWGIPYLLKPASAGEAIAPNPSEFPDAVVQIYGAPVWGVRGRFAIHTWIATKARNDTTYTIYHVLGWRKLRGMSVVSIDEGVPNQEWFGSEPTLLLDKRGEDAQDLVGKIDQAARQYPYPDTYTMWPGPNSNSFIEWIGLNVPELGMALPAKALGKNWMASKFRRGRRVGDAILN
jgi:hypothetical protein